MLRLTFARKNHRNFFIKNLWYLIYSLRMHVVEIFPQMILNAKQSTKIQDLTILLYYNLQLTFNDHLKVNP